MPEEAPLEGQRLVTGDGELRVDVRRWVSDVPERDWDRFAGAEFYMSSGWLRACGATWPGPLACVVARTASDLLGGLPLFLRTAPDGGPYDPAALVASLDGALQVPALRHPVVLGGGRLGYRAHPVLAGGNGRRDVATALLAASLDVAADWDAAGVALLYVPAACLAELRPVLDDQEWAVVPHALEAWLDVRWSSFEEYLSSLSAGRRSAVRRELRTLRSSPLRVETTTQVGWEATIAPLLVQVQHRYGQAASGAAIEASLRASSQTVGDASVLFLLRDEARVVGYCLAYRWHHTLFLRSIGFDYGAGGLRDLYFSLLVYEPLRYAIDHGLRHVHLGGEALEAKVGRGARLGVLWSALGGDGITREVGERLADPARRRVDARVELVAQATGRAPPVEGLAGR